MKNFMVANVQPGAKRSKEDLVRMVRVQILNSLSLGWRNEDIVLVTNFDFQAHGVTALVLPLNSGCLRGSKLFALHALFRDGRIGEEEVYWAHDLDAWQNHAFDCPSFADIGIAEYSRPKYNGGSVFVRGTGGDIVEAVVTQLRATQADREEPTLNEVLRSQKYRDRVTTIDHRFNVGCSGFVERYQRSTKPVLVSHLHPTNRIAWDTHVNDRNNLGVRPMASRLVDLLVEHFHDQVPPKKLSRTRSN